MAQRLINALNKSLSKTASDAVKGTTRRATRDVPSAKSFYNLGMGIGPFIRNTVQSYGQDKATSASDTKKINASLNFAKENVVTQKNIAGQLSALTSIMSDIRKISLAQLDLQRASLNKRFGDRSDYLSQENALEQKGARPSLSGTADQEKKGGLLSNVLGFIGNNPLIGGSLLGLLALANAKNIDRFLEDSGIKQKIKEGTKAAVEGIAGLIATTMRDAILEGLPAIYNSIRKDLRDTIEKAATGDTRGAIQSGTSALSTTGAVAGAIYGFKKGKGLFGRVAGATIGGILGYGGTDYIGNTAADAISPDKNLTPKQQAAQQSSAREKLMEALEAAGLGYGAYKLLGGGKATPTAPPTGTTAPPAVETPTTKAPPRPTTVPGEKPGFSKTAEDKIRERAARMAAEKNSKSFFGRTLALLRKLIEKIGLKRVMAYLALRFGLSAAAGATGFLAGPVGIITTILSVGWTLYEIYDVLSELDRESDNDRTIAEPTAVPVPTQTPAGTLPPTGAGGGRGTQGGATAEQAAGAQGDFASPVPGATGSKGRFGEQREGHLHTGVDLSAPENTPVLSVGEGKVVETGYNNGYGNYVVVEHPNGMRSKYGHMSAIDVKMNDAIKKGQQLGKVGSTGHTEGPHLHLDIINPAGDFLNPRDYINGLPAYSGKDNGANPEGSLKSIPGKGTAINVSGNQNTAPGAGNNNTGAAFASAFGFDPSRMGVDVSQSMTGDQIAKLNALQKDMSSGSAMIADAIGKVNGSQQSRAPSQPGTQPAPSKTVDNPQSKEKDNLWMFYNQSSPYYT